MKTIALCAGCGAVASLAMSYQMGLFEEPAWPDGEPARPRPKCLQQHAHASRKTWRRPARGSR